MITVLILRYSPKNLLKGPEAGESCTDFIGRLSLSGAPKA
jgi:hypothetical protein